MTRLTIPAHEIRLLDYLPHAGGTRVRAKEWRDLDFDGRAELRLTYDDGSKSSWLNAAHVVTVERSDADTGDALDPLAPINATQLLFNLAGHRPALDAETTAAELADYGRFVAAELAKTWDAGTVVVDDSDAMPNPDSDALDQIAELWRDFLSDGGADFEAAITAILDRVRPVKLTPSAALAEVRALADDRQASYALTVRRIRAVLDCTDAP